MVVGGVSFRAPTTTEAEHNTQFNARPKKRNYAEIFDCAPFAAEHLLPLRNQRGRLRKDNTGKQIYSKQATTETVPNIEFLIANGIGLESHPADWFDIFFPKKRTRKTHPKAVTIDELTAWTNTKAVINNSGKVGGKYKGFVNFSSSEIMSYLALYLLHSISPALKIEYKFFSKFEDPVNGSDICHGVFGKNAITRHK